MSRNIKEIGKELMGKSLNSFHRKTGLTQLEKNNEMQDGILDGILSQVDDAYIEKTEQSNVIHLDGSGDGVVVVDGIEGNTMVNLNSKSNYSIHSAIYKRWVIGEILKPNTTYTIISNITNEYLMCCGYNTNLYVEYTDASKKIKFTTPSTLLKGEVGQQCSIWVKKKDATNIDDNTLLNSEVMLLEGDWTNKEIPSYFEGLQSSFEEKVNSEGKYEIEILSQNKNLLNINNIEKNIAQTLNLSKIKVENNTVKFNNDTNVGIRCYYKVKVKPNTTYLFTSTVSRGMVTIYKGKSDTNKFAWGDDYLHGYKNYTPYDNNLCKIQFTTDDNEKHIYVRFSNESIESNSSFSSPILEKSENTTDYVPYKQNKIKLLLKSPLLKGDKLVVKDNELYHYHKWNRLTVDENAQIKEVFYGDTIEGYKKWMVTCKCLTEHPLDATYNNNNNFISNYKENKVGWHIKDTLFIESDKICCVLPNNISETEVKNYIKNNMMAIYRLSEPVYEEVLNEYGEPILLEGYENGTIYIDSTIVPTTTVRYTPKMESFKTLKEVENNNIMLTNDVNDNIIPYMMDVDLMIMEKEMALMSHKNIRTIGVKDMTSMQKRTQDMLTRLIKGKTLTEQECKTRVVTYLDAGKITDAQADELMLLISEVYA